jgi:phosphoglycolate phosphatase
VNKYPAFLINMKNIKLIIFDLDGTLVNAYPAIIRSFNYTMRKLGYPKQANPEICRSVGWGDDNLLRPFIKLKDLKKALKIYRRHHRISLIQHSSLFPKVNRIMRYLKNKGYTLAVASNRPTQFSWILIRHLGLKKYFDYVLCADKLKHIKPHPEILNKIIQRFHLARKQALYIGDMTVDASAGRRARIKTIIVTTGSSTRQEIKKEKPYLIIPRISKLLKIL